MSYDRMPEREAALAASPRPGPRPPIPPRCRVRRCLGRQAAARTAHPRGQAVWLRSARRRQPSRVSEARPDNPDAVPDPRARRNSTDPESRMMRSRPDGWSRATTSGLRSPMAGRRRRQAGAGSRPDSRPGDGCFASCGPTRAAPTTRGARRSWSRLRRDQGGPQVPRLQPPGLEAVKAEWKLVVAIHNLGKLFGSGRAGRVLPGWTPTTGRATRWATT
jgi:hypothetical protein